MKDSFKILRIGRDSVHVGFIPSCFFYFEVQNYFAPDHPTIAAPNHAEHLHDLRNTRVVI